MPSRTSRCRLRGIVLSAGIALLNPGGAPAVAAFVYVPPGSNPHAVSIALSEALETILPPDARVLLAIGLDPEAPVPAAATSAFPGRSWQARLAEICWSLAVTHDVSVAPGQEVLVRIWPRGSPLHAHVYEVVRAPTRWTAEAGETLREALERWAAAANREVVFETDLDWRFEDPVRAGGSWRWAVRSLFEALAGTDPAPVGELVQDGAVLLVRAAEGGRE